MNSEYQELPGEPRMPEAIADMPVGSQVRVQVARDVSMMVSRQQYFVSAQNFMDDNEHFTTYSRILLWLCISDFVCSTILLFFIAFENKDEALIT
jgi:hypothetical protein